MHVSPPCPPPSPPGSNPLANRNVVLTNVESFIYGRPHQAVSTTKGFSLWMDLAARDYINVNGTLTPSGSELQRNTRELLAVAFWVAHAPDNTPEAPIYVRDVRSVASGASNATAHFANENIVLFEFDAGEQPLSRRVSGLEFKVLGLRAPFCVRDVRSVASGASNATAHFKNEQAVLFEFDADAAPNFTYSGAAAVEAANPLLWWTLECETSALFPTPCLSSSLFTNAGWFKTAYGLWGWRFVHFGIHF
ncbi:hypothetical protein FOA52_005832 [Chlamydomonas sp. UWO 241]|nr:hypothetical protein FOA52_005832 [Chlamydomonas sp. UWO 241]